MMLIVVVLLDDGYDTSHDGDKIPGGTIDDDVVVPPSIQLLLLVFIDHHTVRSLSYNIEHFNFNLRHLAMTSIYFSLSRGQSLKMLVSLSIKIRNPIKLFVSIKYK